MCSSDLNFDGIHLGHQEIIKRAVKDGEGSGFKSSVFTFSNHPRNLLSKNKKVKNILFNDDKERIIKSLGVDYIYNIPFTEELMKMKPVDFIESILIEKMNMKEVICGFNYRFGNRAEGDVKLLTEESVKRDFRC